MAKARSSSTELAARLDEHLLLGVPSRAEIVTELLVRPPPDERARPYYEGMRILGPRTPELALIALRLTLSGRRADDDTVVRLRSLLEVVRGGGAAGKKAREEYGELLAES